LPSPHIFNPKNIAVLEMEDRIIWRNPEEILETLKIEPNLVAADLGCGSGFFTIPLSKGVKKVYAIDVQKRMLEFLEEKIRRLKIKNIEPLLSTENEIPLENDSLDLLLSMNTLHEFDDKERMVEQIRRVLKQSGTAVIADFKKEDTGFGPPVAIRFSKQQAVNLFEKKGFTTLQREELKYHYLLTFVKNLKCRAPKRST
jgi:ubiquinone/menaquinone biosynthesis C-methylase UbiE